MPTLSVAYVYKMHLSDRLLANMRAAGQCMLKLRTMLEQCQVCQSLATIYEDVYNFKSNVALFHLTRLMFY